jgi:hypothetical protein
MVSLPDILLQIHYHFRTGGVSTVVQRYAEVYSECAESKMSYLFASPQGALYTPSFISMISEKKCDYSDVISLSQFTSIKNDLKTKLITFLNEHQGKTIAVIAHNLTLGKNCALTAAFYEIAMENGSDTIRFFSVIHDFAEESRKEQLDLIYKVKSLGIPINTFAYGVNAPIHFITPNYEAFTLMKHCRRKISLIYNPVNVSSNEPVNVFKEEIIHQFKIRGIQVGAQSGKETPLIYYPSRIITRKNIAEAIVLSLIGLNGLLITGPSGGSNKDSLRDKQYAELAEKYCLPILSNAGKCIESYLIDKKQIVPTLYKCADLVVSTSIAEGFGYSLYEPWIFNKPLIARIPNGFSFPQWYKTSSLYNRFPVPVEWVDKEKVIKKYEEFYYQCFREKMDMNIWSEILFEKYVDFGALDEWNQIEIIKMVLNESEQKKKWQTLLQNGSSGWVGLQGLYNNAQNNLNHNTADIQKGIGKDAFIFQFKECLQIIPELNKEVFDFNEVIKYFRSADKFRVLLS